MNMAADPRYRDTARRAFGLGSGLAAYVAMSIVELLGSAGSASIDVPLACAGMAGVYAGTCLARRLLALPASGAGPWPERPPEGRAIMAPS